MSCSSQSFKKYNVSYNLEKLKLKKKVKQSDEVFILQSDKRGWRVMENHWNVFFLGNAS